MNDLTQNINKIHTTPLGMERIKRNLNLIDVEDPASWCVQQIKNSKNIVRKGKNWYVNIGNAIITINAHTHTIITAHKLQKKTQP